MAEEVAHEIGKGDTEGGEVAQDEMAEAAEVAVAGLIAQETKGGKDEEGDVAVAVRMVGEEVLRALGIEIGGVQTVGGGHKNSILFSFSRLSSFLLSSIL